MDLRVYTQRRLYQYRLQVLGMEELDLPLGRANALHLRHTGEKPEETVDVWLGVDHHFLPGEAALPDRAQPPHGRTDRHLGQGALGWPPHHPHPARRDRARAHGRAAVAQPRRRGPQAPLPRQPQPGQPRPRAHRGYGLCGAAPPPAARDPDALGLAARTGPRLPREAAGHGHRRARAACCAARSANWLGASSRPPTSPPCPSRCRRNFPTGSSRGCASATPMTRSSRWRRACSNRRRSTCA